MLNLKPLLETLDMIARESSSYSGQLSMKMRTGRRAASIGIDGDSVDSVVVRKDVGDACFTTAGYYSIDSRHAFRRLSEKTSRRTLLMDVFALVESVNEDSLNRWLASAHWREHVVRPASTMIAERGT